MDATTILAVATFLTSLAALVRAWQAHSKGVDNNKAIVELHLLINSRMTQLIEAAQAEGQVKERAEADARNAAKDSK